MNQFEAEADKWWDDNGPFNLLHKMNPIRLRYIRDHIGEPKRKKAIDIGCGGGILTIPMARMGMEVSGLDIGKKNIDIARAKSKEAEVDIKYYVGNLEEITSLPEHREQYDLVTSMEVIEHVNDYKIFLIHLCKLVKPGGYLFLSTINRTTQSYLKAIVAAEYILNLVPKGTHEWKSFLKPSEITEVVEACDLKLIDITGIKLNWRLNEWQQSQDVSINYIMSFNK
jgi:2-polyprenyl-6-hydroxyphenyl methylase/3-demethylubiquinone-9 3-methyltransferase